MATTETDELLRRARDLAERSSVGDPAARADFTRALNRLRRLAGKPPLRVEGADFEDDVHAALLGLRDAVVALSPAATEASRRPDFMVSRGTQVALAEAVSRRPFSQSRVRRRARELAKTLPHYRATRGLIVVPDNVHSSVAPSGLEPTVELVRLSGLASALDRILGGNA